MEDLLKDVGAVAGLASFFGLALLALLYFAQARDVRRLRENASFLVEGGTPSGEGEPAEQTATTVATKEPEKAAAAAAAEAPNEAEAFRRAELARQAAERRQRFEKRRGGRGDGGGRQRPGWMSEPSSVAVIVIGAILLVAGIAFGVTRVTGGDDDSGTPAASKGKGPCPPGQTNVAVLNGTATAGLAANFAAPLKKAGYTTKPVGNTSTPFTTSVVMFDPQTGQQCAPGVSTAVGITKQQPMSAEIRGIAEAAPVAVVLGDDQTGESTSTDTSGTTSSGF